MALSKRVGRGLGDLTYVIEIVFGLLRVLDVSPTRLWMYTYSLRHSRVSVRIRGLCIQWQYIELPPLSRPTRTLLRRHVTFRPLWRWRG
eukprot:3781726-Prorocentrum_lima.AAC.1